MYARVAGRGAPGRAPPRPNTGIQSVSLLDAHAPHLPRSAAIGDNSDHSSSTYRSFWLISQFVQNQDGRRVIYNEHLKYSRYFYKAYKSCFLVRGNNHFQTFQVSYIFSPGAYHNFAE